jgi:hypothetical protein
MADVAYTPPPAPTPSVPSRSSSSRRSPPSPIKKAFNFLFGMCKSTSDVVHKEREKRKKDTIRLKKMQAVLLPNDPPSPPCSDEVQRSLRAFGSSLSTSSRWTTIPHSFLLGTSKQVLLQQLQQLCHRLLQPQMIRLTLGSSSGQLVVHRSASSGPPAAPGDGDE